MKKIICLFLMFSFFVTGCYFNNAKFHELEQELTNFLNDVNESNYLTFTLSDKGMKMSAKTTQKAEYKRQICPLKLKGILL